MLTRILQVCSCHPLRKRHRAWSNTRAIGLLDRGKLKAAARKQCILKATEKKLKKDGTRSYCGTKQLKQTQSGPQLLHKSF